MTAQMSADPDPVYFRFWRVVHKQGRPALASPTPPKTYVGRSIPAPRPVTKCTTPRFRCLVGRHDTPDVPDWTCCGWAACTTVAGVAAYVIHKRWPGLLLRMLGSRRLAVSPDDLFALTPVQAVGPLDLTGGPIVAAARLRILSIELSPPAWATRGLAGELAGQFGVPINPPTVGALWDVLDPDLPDDVALAALELGRREAARSETP